MNKSDALPLASLFSEPELLDKSVIQDRHAQDGMYRDDLAHYLWCGRDGLRNMALALMLSEKKSPRRILDFACGFGRVGRYIRAAFPTAEIVFSDISVKACTYCAETFAGRHVPVKADFSTGTVGMNFDLIWVGSLFTHLDRATSSRYLNILYESLAPGAALVMTLHGRYVASRHADGEWPYNIDNTQFEAMIRDAKRDGYGFVPYNGSENYGISLVSTDWWESEVAALSSAQVVLFREKGWARHQDVLAIKKLK